MVTDSSRAADNSSRQPTGTSSDVVVGETQRKRVSSILKPASTAELLQRRSESAENLGSRASDRHSVRFKGPVKSEPLKPSAQQSIDNLAPFARDILAISAESIDADDDTVRSLLSEHHSMRVSDGLEAPQLPDSESEANNDVRQSSVSEL